MHYQLEELEIRAREVGLNDQEALERFQKLCTPELFLYLLGFHNSQKDDLEEMVQSLEEDLASKEDEISDNEWEIESLSKKLDKANNKITLYKEQLRKLLKDLE